MIKQAKRTLNEDNNHNNTETSDSDYEENIKNEDNDLDEDEKRLENLVFGSETNIIDNIEKKKKKKHKKLKQISDAFETRKAAWKDDDDDEIVDLKNFEKLSNKINGNKNNVVKATDLEENLKARYVKYFGQPVWADLDKNDKKEKKLEGDYDEDEDSDTEMFQHTGNYLTKSQFLPGGSIDIKKCTDANKEAPHQARLKCVEFHPTARVLLAAGLNQTLTLFQIDGKKNSKIQSIFLEKFPILNAHFSKNGEEIIMGSRHKSFYYYDMISGKIVNVPPVKALEENRMSSFEISPNNSIIAFIGSYGNIHLFSAKSKEWIDSLKVNDTINTITFSSDSKYLYTFGDDKEVHVFDMESRSHQSVHKFHDYGCLCGHSIAISNNNQFIATGCKSGVINIYNVNDTFKNKSPKPLKTFMNLTTPCTQLKFNCTGEILAACSAFTESACKLIHVPSMTVFSNFPTKFDNLRIPISMDFSLNSGYFTIGNHKGNALLYRLKHYGSF